jgi:hypothetical protein
MEKEEVGTASIPAPGSRSRETASGRMEDCGAAEASAEEGGDMEVTVHEFKNVSVIVEVFRLDVRIAITQRRDDDPLVILASQKICADHNRIANELEMDTYLEEIG